MRILVRVLFAAPALVALLASGSQAAPTTQGNSAQRNSPQSRTADEWYGLAVQAAVEGDDAARDEALDAAVAADPDHAPSRGERGEIEVDGRWVSARYAQQLAADDPDRDEYGERLQNIDDTPASHVRMAKWCEKAGLRPEARAHWIAVLTADPKNAAALEGIGMQWRDGQLWDVDQAAEADERVEEFAKQAKSWEKRLRRFESKPYFDEDEFAWIRDGLDAGAINPIERRIAQLPRLKDPEAAQRCEKLIQAYLERSVDMPEVEVTASLSRIAIYGGDTHRSAAIDVLKDRPENDAMPMLLSHLIAPIDSNYRISRDARGNVVYQHRLKRENAEGDEVHDRNRTATVSVAVNNAAPQGFRAYTTQDSLYLAQIQARFEGVKQAIEYQNEAEMTNAFVATHNSVAKDLNDRVRTALSAVSGRSLSDNPLEWWQYWQRYSGYDTYNRATERTYDVTATHQQVTAMPTYERLPPPPPPRRCECFVAGTPVWTRDGKQPIETLKAGDLVLSRDPYRGGIVYRVVTGATVREPSPMVEVVAGGESIHATVGHPFWVLGRGWRMAKELAAGDVLSTVYGPVTVTAVNDYQSAAAHNLVVENAANYYVGDNGVLVHDNTPRVPAVGLVARR